MTWTDRQADLLEALNYLDPDALNYEEWCQVGMALKEEGLESQYDPWSRRGAKYKEGEPGRKMESFKRNGITGNYIFRLAQNHGWINPGGGKTPVKTDPEVKEDKEIKRLRKILKAHNTKDIQIKEPAEDDLIVYIETLFKKDDIITLTLEADYSGNKWRPIGYGKSYKAADLVNMLTKFSVMETLNYNQEAGVWIRVNPMDGIGCSDSDVMEYRYTLIECDDLPIQDQLSLVYELQLPAAAIVHSGGKSIHAVVRIDAEDGKQYTERVRFMYDICRRYGLSVDTANKNPSRLTRLPGVTRGGGKQYLIDTNTGCKNYQQWENMTRKGLYGIEVLHNALAKPIPLRPALIQGVLRVGHKMMIASSSKAGKTYLLMYLAIAIAEGREWLGFPCMKGKVLYLNMEIDTASAEHRFQELCRVMNLDQIPENIDLMNLRGESDPLDRLAARIIEVVRGLKENYLCIIVDPFYKVLTGDENSNTDMAQMAKSADLITEETGASLIYVHHYSKGKQYEKRAIDRASGAGTFGRDADAFMTLTAYDEKTTYGDSVLECEFITREFKTPADMMVRFNYPLFEVVSRSEYPDASMEKRGKTAKEKEEINAKIEEAFRCCPKVTADTGKTGVHKKELLSMIQKMFPEVIPAGLSADEMRTKERLLVERNDCLKNVGRDGKNAVYQITTTTL